MSPRSETDLRVVRVTAETAEVRSFVLAAESGAELPQWGPGAHIDLHLPGGLTRQYSLCGDPGDRRYWRIAVLREPAGRGGSRYLHEAVTTASTLRVGVPRNNFPLAAAPRYRFVAGGIGITPLLPMIAAVHAAGAPWTLHYGGRTRAGMAFVGELAVFGDRVRLYPQDRCGLIPLPEVFGADDAAVYCCGPEPLLQAAERQQLARGSGSLHLERFQPAELDADPAADGAFEVELRDSGRTIGVAAGQSVLSALHRAGVDVPSSCEEGTCGSCETTVLEGEVDHRDSVLNEQERAAGRTMMLCVSRARSPRLVLDL
ncbi:PDR/VanB family oxidoreductase [Nocardia sp. alder85J]|uniref:PDR/VanB family oxidoreductase n=1 Tax=Nocardia sp. alder85J TaxID=2862949 RepID=UPI001CD7E26E|nr:PDR/VanB family oxidoreductase [Nocardia sp. alder85J]MCX4091556.1 PDR/VanB family oxidoreductase [Nocardia sp. alder85J]